MGSTNSQWTNRANERLKLCLQVRPHHDIIVARIALIATICPTLHIWCGHTAHIASVTVSSRRFLQFNTSTGCILGSRQPQKSELFFETGFTGGYWNLTAALLTRLFSATGEFDPYLFLQAATRRLLSAFTWIEYNAGSIRSCPDVTTKHGGRFRGPRSVGRESAVKRDAYETLPQAEDETSR